MKAKQVTISTQRAVRTGSYITVPRGKARWPSRYKASVENPYGRKENHK